MTQAAHHGHQPERRGIATVQALRALACLLVVGYHAVDTWAAHMTPAGTADALWPNGAAGVDLFFVISGFVMARSAQDLTGPRAAGRFMVRRLQRVAPLYWALTLAKLLVMLAVPTLALPGVWHVTASFLFVPSRDAAGLVRPVLGVGWTLQFEMLFYALFALTLAHRRSAPPAKWPILAVLAPLAVAGFFRRSDWPAPLFLANGLVLEFCLGMGLSAWTRPGRHTPEPAAWGAIAVGLALLLALPPSGPWRFVAWGGPASLVLCGAVALEARVAARLPGLLLAIGDASYAIYLVHPFLVPAMFIGLRHAFRGGAGLAGLIAASLCASVLAGVALHRWVDKPAQAWLSARWRGARPSLVSAETLAQLVQT